MIQDTTPASLLIRTNTYAFCDDEKKRREGALKNKDYFYGRQEQYLSLLNADVDPVTVNLTNPIVGKRSSLLYNRPLVRIFDGPSPSVKAIEDLYSKMKIDNLLQQVDLSAELTGTCLIFVGIDDKEQIMLMPYDASAFSAVSYLDYKTLEALQIVSVNDVVYQNGANIQVKRSVDSEVWTENYVYRISNGLQDPNPTVNELGFIPFTSFKAQEVVSQFLGHSPSISIRQLNTYINQQLTNLGYMIKMQSATPVVLNGFQNGESVSVHPGTAISLPVGASAGVLALNPKIMETLEVVKYLEDKMYQTSSVPRISVLGDSAGSTSGVELLIKWAPLTSVFKEKANRYQKYELDLANMILAVMDEEPLKDLKVMWPEDTLLPVDPDREKLAEDITLGIRTPIDEVLKLNTNLTEADAEALVRANLDFNKSLNNGGLDANRQQ
jgi:hypothetical protein